MPCVDVALKSIVCCTLHHKFTLHFPKASGSRLQGVWLVALCSPKGEAKGWGANDKLIIELLDYLLLQ